jgi:predicted RNase H-like HicB family nuclease
MKVRLEVSAKRYPVIIESTNTGFSAYSPDVPGCAAVGDSEEETRLNIQEALAFHFEGLRIQGVPIPLPSCSGTYVELA